MYTVNMAWLSLLFAAALSSCAESRPPAAQNRYDLNPQEHLGAVRIAEADAKPLMAEISYFNDPSADLTLNEVASRTFTATTPKFNPGFYKGILYIDVAFEPPEEQSVTEFMLWLGDEPLDFAEAYRPLSDGSWTFLGRTGRMILTSQMTFPSWRLAIPFSTKQTAASAQEDGREHILIRTQAYAGAPMDIRLLPARQFSMATHRMLMLQFLALGMYAIATIFILVYGIMGRSREFTTLGAGAALFILLMLQQKGFGPAYIWNSISSLPHSPRLIYYLSALTFMLIFIAFITFAKKYMPRKFPQKFIPAIIIVTILFFATSVAVQSPVVVYVIFQSVSVLLTLAAAVSLALVLVRHRKHMQLEFKLTTVCWSVAALVVSVCQFFRLMRTVSGAALFTLFDSDGFIMLDVSFVLILAPAIYSVIKHLRTEAQSISTKNETLESDQTLYNDANRELLSMGNVILNTVRISRSSVEDRKSADRSLALIESAALHSTDILNMLALIQSKAEPQAQPILLIPFFRSCMKAIDCYFQKDLFTLSTQIQEQTMVFANSRLLEFIFKSFMQSVARCSTRTDSIEVTLEGKGNTLSCAIGIPHENGRIPPEPKATEMRILARAAKLYGGTVAHEQDGRCTTHSLSLELPQTPASDADELLVQTATAEEEVAGNLSRSEAGAPGTPFMPPRNERITILLAEGNAESRRLFTSLVGNGADLEVAENGATAWDILSDEARQLPDILIMEYQLPFVSGSELLAKYREDERVRAVPVIAIVSAHESHLRPQIIKNGAAACLVRPFRIEELFTLVHAILDIRDKARSSVITNIRSAMNAPFSVQPGSAKQTKAPAVPGADVLSSREAQIAALVAAGKSDKEIAEQLGISPATVATHNKNIFKKLGVHSRVELMGKIR